MNVDQKLEAVAVDSSDPAAVVKAIEEFETSIQMLVGKEFAHLSQDVYKSMRRILPITKTKLKWETIGGCMSYLLIL
jgi:hypothetical protein